MGLLGMRLRALYLLLAAEGGVRDRPYRDPTKEEEPIPGKRGEKPSLRAHSSAACFPRLGDPPGLSGDDNSRKDSERVRWKRGSVLLSISVAERRKPVSERLPFFSNRALKLSLLVADLRRLRWMELAWRGSEAELGEPLVGVTGGDGEWPRDLSSSDSLRPNTFRLDLTGAETVC